MTGAGGPKWTGTIVSDIYLQGSLRLLNLQLNHLNYGKHFHFILCNVCLTALISKDCIKLGPNTMVGVGIIGHIYGNIIARGTSLKGS